ncbi:hypothetical protein [Natrinema salaciae]|uniref:Uncharacterized protein n=1 Tax=Natrinema salaciae TaxID=1186196 RepID=A0A1H9F0B5_9EURY|nr:hypothetical protein [Natrinema salaciae]SEQ30688.1 hypothetical protein SAMN04489841_1417 [Natrinema salaciae]
MTDFTDTIDTTAASIEDLQEDLKAHLEDMLGFGVTVEDAEIRIDEKYGDRLSVEVEIGPLERELERRLGADEVWTSVLSLEITPSAPKDRSNDIEGGIREMAKEEAEDVVHEAAVGDPE